MSFVDLFSVIVCNDYVEYIILILWMNFVCQKMDKLVERDKLLI